MSTPTCSTQLVWRSRRQQEHEGNWEGGEKQQSGEGATREKYFRKKNHSFCAQTQGHGGDVVAEFGMMAN